MRPSNQLRASTPLSATSAHLDWVLYQVQQINFSIHEPLRSQSWTGDYQVNPFRGVCCMQTPPPLLVGRHGSEWKSVRAPRPNDIVGNPPPNDALSPRDLALKKRRIHLTPDPLPYASPRWRQATHYVI